MKAGKEALATASLGFTGRLPQRQSKSPPGDAGPAERPWTEQNKTKKKF
jgi:hypothetical protein